MYAFTLLSNCFSNFTLSNNALIMKKIILLILCFFILFPFNSKASHLMGGEITVQHISGNDYAILATAY